MKTIGLRVKIERRKTASGAMALLFACLIAPLAADEPRDSAMRRRDPATAKRISNSDKNDSTNDRYETDSDSNDPAVRAKKSIRLHVRFRIKSPLDRCRYTTPMSHLIPRDWLAVEKALVTWPIGSMLIQRIFLFMAGHCTRWLTWVRHSGTSGRICSSTPKP